MLGLVPVYEEREAARWGVYRWIDWNALPYDDRVTGVAHYRVWRMIGLWEAEAGARHAEKQS